MGLLIRNGTLVLPDRLEISDIHIGGNKILSVYPQFDSAGISRETEVIDASGLYVFPGFIDAHTHYGLGEGSEQTADGFFEGSRAAAFGGITTFIDFSDQIPGMSLVQGALKRISEAGDSVVDYTLHQGIYRMRETLHSELDDLKQMGISTVKLFTTYREFGVFFDPSGWDSLFPLCRDRKIMVCIHAEDDEIISSISRDYPEMNLSPAMHPVLRPPEAEAEAIKKVGKAAEDTKTPLYIVHLSSESGLEEVRTLRNRGVRVMTETTPHYLYLTEEKLKGTEGARMIMTPPLRTDRDNAALQQALKTGEIDIVATDHCSYRPSLKMSAADCREIPAGIPGSEEMGMMVYSRFCEGNERDLINMGNLLSRNPAEAFGLYPGKGSLLPGTDADLVLFSPGDEGCITDEGIHSASGYSPYSGLAYNGKPVMTIFRGEVIVRGGRFHGKRGRGAFRCHLRHQCGNLQMLGTFRLTFTAGNTADRSLVCFAESFVKSTQHPVVFIPGGLKVTVHGCLVEDPEISRYINTMRAGHTVAAGCTADILKAVIRVPDSGIECLLIC